MRLRDLALSLAPGEAIELERLDERTIRVRARYHDGTSTRWHRDVHIGQDELTCARIDLAEDAIDRARHEVAGASGR